MGGWFFGGGSPSLDFLPSILQKTEYSNRFFAQVLAQISGAQIFAPIFGQIFGAQIFAQIFRRFFFDVLTLEKNRCSRVTQKCAENLWKNLQCPNGEYPIPSPLS